jgi:hypothetical protein
MATGQNRGDDSRDDSGDDVSGDDEPTEEPDGDQIRFLRPLGYVADHPVVRPLGVLGLHLGNRHATMPNRHEYSFDAVLTVSRERLPTTTHLCPLVDGEGNDWVAFETAVDTARDLARREGAVLVHCNAGVSRSTAVLATVVAVETGRSLGAAIRLVESARPSALPHPALLELGVYYLAARE